MKILESSSDRLVIKDGAAAHWTDAILLRKLSRRKQDWFSFLELLGVYSLGALALLLLSWLLSYWVLNLSRDFVVYFLGAFLVALTVLIACYAANMMRLWKSPLYVFDKLSGLLIINYAQTYNLADIQGLQVEVPQQRWYHSRQRREIHLILKSGKILKLHPDPQDVGKYGKVPLLLRDFLFSD